MTFLLGNVSSAAFKTQRLGSRLKCDSSDFFNPRLVECHPVMGKV